MATIQELLNIGKEKLESAGNEYAKYERKVLLEEVLGCNYMFMLMNPDEEVSLEKETEYLRLIDERCKHYPLQYLLGYAHFMDYTFCVNENVLIPRNDTEILVEIANDVLEQVSTNAYKVLDLCCGSGCIGISLKLYHNDIDLTLSDVSKAALDVTRKNLERHDVKAKVVCDSLFAGINEKQNMIVSNPPYIESRVIDTLMPEVKEYEPMLALDGGKEGMDFYNQIIEEAPSHLNVGGWLLFEIGYNQGEAVSKKMTELGFQDVHVKKDYAGLDRVVYGHL
ncbi:MAG: peptide chain release factor N(5)-glutamine methyltransferase [Lachnospiraceae bacterium]|nr:peptide chain release factor N(5)-glutamine methyltransferase [Lachnospiraceae bacterium]